MDDFHCSFCGKRRAEVRKLISGPRIFICDACVGVCVDIVEKEKAAAASASPPPPAEKKERPDLRCNFCGKAHREVQKMIAGGAPASPIYICNECVGLCVEIIQEGDLV